MKCLIEGKFYEKVCEMACGQEWEATMKVIEAMYFMKCYTQKTKEKEKEAEKNELYGMIYF